MFQTLSALQPLPHSSLESFEDLRHGRSFENVRFSHLEDDTDPIRAIKRYKEIITIHTEGGFSNLAFAPILKACSKASALSSGEQIHARSIKCGLSTDVFVQTSLVGMYSSCGQLETAMDVFDRMPQRNVVTWTTMMNSCLKSEQHAMALVVFRKMQKAGVKPDDFAIVSFLTACAHLGALNLGKWVHAYIKRMGFELTVFTGTALIDMYCKCGNVDDALGVFNSMTRKCVRSWNAMLHGLSVHGRGAEALCLFSEMETDGGICPNEVTFVAILCGCSHSGLVEEGQFYFGLMQNKYGIKPTVKHYGCMVDLLGRAGLLNEAFEIVTKMPVPPNVVVWGSLLSACRAQNNVAMAECVNQRIVGVQENSLIGDTSHHVIMSNMYARAGLNNKMAEARGKVGKKPKGMSWIEIGCDVHEFAVGDASHPMWENIMKMLDEMTGKVGLQEDLQNAHSEKLAVAFGLISTHATMPIRIVKNLRICEDCHGMMKVLSEVYEREIIVRDCTRFHQFIGGCCSCKDYW